MDPPFRWVLVHLEQSPDSSRKSREDPRSLSASPPAAGSSVLGFPRQLKRDKPAGGHPSALFPLPSALAEAEAEPPPSQKGLN